MSTAIQSDDQRAEALPTLAGHPTGLFMLFFAEMWERFSYYGMRALLVLYMLKGFLGFGDSEAYSVYGAYTALVYATPFIGGAIADRLLGTRKAVVFGGLMMAAGHLLMTVEVESAFFTALALLIVGNGFFKPNISTIVGTLYPKASTQRDGGFTLFYMGINLGAAMSPLLCGYIGETYGWHYGFGLATLGMLVGLAVFVAPAGVTRLLILVGALTTAGSMIYLNLDKVIWVLGPNAFVAVALAIAGVVAFVAIGRGGLPVWAGAPSDPEVPGRKVLGPITVEWAVYGGALIAVPLLAMLVQSSDIAGYTLTILGVSALVYLLLQAFRGTRIERDRLLVAVVLMFFSMLFWAFFEQAGSSMNLFADRNVDRVFETEVIAEAQVGQTVDVALTQELAGRTNGDLVVTLDWIDGKVAAGEETVPWQVSADDVGMPLAGDQVATSQFQAANPIFIMIFGLAFTWLWTFLGRRHIDPSAPVKFGLGLVQLGLGFAALWYGAQHADARGMVGMSWLLLAYLLHTTGELCLSPVGLSVMTKLSPARITSMVMGCWFMASAFSNYLAAIIAALTGVHEGGEGEGALPPPSETLGLYGDVFGPIALTAIASGVLLFLLSPFLKKMMHLEADDMQSHTGQAGGH